MDSFSRQFVLAAGKNLKLQYLGWYYDNTRNLNKQCGLTWGNILKHLQILDLDLNPSTLIENHVHTIENHLHTIGKSCTHGLLTTIGQIQVICNRMDILAPKLLSYLG